ncbi:hypothetical protein Tco_1310341 [Tanacetum coccineum]
MYIFNNLVKHLEGGVKFLMYPRFVQVFLNKQVEGMTRHKELYVTPSHTKKVFANMKRPGKGFSGRVTPLIPTLMIQASEIWCESEDLAALLLNSHSYPIILNIINKPQRRSQGRNKGKNLQEKVLDLEKAKTAQAKEITSLKVRESQAIRNLECLGGLDPKSREEIKDLDADAEQEIEFVKVVEEPVVSVATTTKSIPVSAAEVVTTANARRTNKAFSSSQSQLPQVKDKGKGKMVEPEVPLKKKDQVALDEEMARNLEIVAANF